MSEDERKPLTWEQQRDEIQRLNAKCIAYAAGLIDGTTVEEKGKDREGDPIYTEVSDGVDMLAKCSTIARQWMSMDKKDGEASSGAKSQSDDVLMRKAVR